MKSVVLNQKQFLSLGQHLAMFGIFLVVITGVVNRIQWPESQGCSQTSYQALDSSSQRKNCLAPSVNSTDTEEPTLRCAFVMVCFLSQFTLWNLTSVNTGPSYTLDSTWIWSPCHVIFTQTLNQMECRPPESSIRSLSTDHNWNLLTFEWHPHWQPIVWLWKFYLMNMCISFQIEA